MIFLDSSALVKRYIKEIGTDHVNAIFSSSPLMAASKLAYPEILSAFMRKRRADELSRSLLHSVMNKFENDWTSFFVIELSDEVLRPAKRIIEKYALKAADAVHLASASWLKSST